jgi:DNA-binding CsgD family transcriptional regulator
MAFLASKSTWDQMLDAVYRVADPNVDPDHARKAIEAFCASLPINSSTGDGSSIEAYQHELLAAIEHHVARSLAIRATLETCRENRARPAQLILAMARPAGIRTGAGEAILWNQSATAMTSAIGLDLEADQLGWKSECRQAVRDGWAALSLGKGITARLTHLSQATRTTTGMASAYGLETIIVELVKNAPPPILVPLKLTSAEQDILAHLRDGAAIREIATARGTSLATVRRQIKLLKTKTGRKSLASLAGHVAETSGG